MGQKSYELESEIITQGDTGTASVIEYRVVENTDGRAKRYTGDIALRINVCNDGTFANSTNATIAPTTGYGTTLVTHTSSKDLTLGTPADAQETGTLTISGVVINGETVLINGRVYEFSTDGTIDGASDYEVDISASGTKSQGTLSMATKPTAGDTVTVGSTVYTFKVTALVPGDVAIGAAVANSQTALVAAINGTDTINSANAQASAAAFAANDSVITALYTGTQGDAIVTTETFTDATDAFDAATLGTTTAGVDVAATDAGDALVTALAADASSVVTGVNTTGTVVLTADAVGVYGYTTTETMANGAFGAAVMSGGTSSAQGSVRVSVTDASAETVTMRVGAALIGGFPINYYAAAFDLAHDAP